MSTPEAFNPAKFWRFNDGEGTIIPPMNLSELLNPRWLPAPENCTGVEREPDKTPPQSQSDGGPQTRSKTRGKGKDTLSRSPYVAPSQRHSYSPTKEIAKHWFATHLDCNWTLKKVCRLPSATLHRTFRLVDDLVDSASNTNEGQADEALPIEKAKLDPWKDLTPETATSESEISLFYSNLLSGAFLPALSLLLVRKCLDGEVCRRYPRFFKVASDSEHVALTQSLCIITRARSTPKPDVLVSLETFGYNGCVTLFRGDMPPEERDAKGAFKLDAVVPGLQHLALGETKTPGSVQGRVLLSVELLDKKGAAWDVPTLHQCICLTDGSQTMKDCHDKDVGRKWEYKKA